MARGFRRQVCRTLDLPPARLTCSPSGRKFMVAAEIEVGGARIHRMRPPSGPPLSKGTKMSIVSKAVVLGLLLCSQPAPFSSGDGILRGGADPTIVAIQGGQGGYYVVATGRGIPLLYSSDLKDWRRIGRVFADDVPPGRNKTSPRPTASGHPISASTTDSTTCTIPSPALAANAPSSAWRSTRRWTSKVVTTAGSTTGR